MSFQSDLLISYAHLDDQALLEGQPGWVSNLHRILEIRIGQLLGEKPRIWRDPKLQGNDYFADTILIEQLPRVAALLTVLSPRYVQSEWCNRELEEFCRASARSGGVRVGDKARIFKVVKTPVPRERHPEPLQPLLGYEFYVSDPQTGRPRELSHFFGPEAERQFLARLDDLAWDICQLLQILKANGSAAGAQGLPPQGTIYLAETSFDLREEREAVRRDLLRNGYEVLPDRPLPLIASDLASFVQEQLARCILSIHLVGHGYGLVPDGSMRSIVALQHDAAAERSGLPRLLWLPPGLAPEDERQRSFVEHLRTAPGVHAESEILETSLEDLKSRIHCKLAPREPKQEKTIAPAAQSGIVRIYLVCDQADLEAARPLEDFLFGRGFEVVPTLFDDDLAQARCDHEESLCTCDAVLVFQGEASEMWLRRKLREIQKSAGLGRERPMLARGIYVAAPRTPQKERFRTLEAMVLREPPEGFSSGVLEPFLAELVGSKGAGA
jgi:hypothetical protein